MAKYTLLYKVKSGLGGTLHMIVDAPSGYVVNEIVPSMFAEIGGESYRHSSSREVNI